MLVEAATPIEAHLEQPSQTFNGINRVNVVDHHMLASSGQAKHCTSGSARVLRKMCGLQQHGGFYPA